MDKIFETASRKKLRFPSARGDLTVEQLWDMKMTSVNGFSLDAVYRGIKTELNGQIDEGLVPVGSNPEKELNELRLEIVKRVFDVKQEEAAKAANRVQRSEERRKVLEAIANKKDEQLSQASIEDLEKKLEAIDSAD